MDGIELPQFPGYMIFRDGSIVGPRGRKLKPQVMDNGYLLVQMYVDGVRVARVLVHRLVAAAYLGLDLTDSITVDHDSEIKSENDVRNLSLMTDKDNRDKYWSGKRPNDTVGQKECRVCGQLKDRSEFDSKKDSFDKLDGQCRTCKKQARYLRNNKHKETK